MSLNHLYSGRPGRSRPGLDDMYTAAWSAREAEGNPAPRAKPHAQGLVPLTVDRYSRCHRKRKEACAHEGTRGMRCEQRARSQRSERRRPRDAAKHAEPGGPWLPCTSASTPTEASRNIPAAAAATRRVSPAAVAVYYNWKLSMRNGTEVLTYNGHRDPNFTSDTSYF